MAPKFFLLPALAVVVAFVGLTNYYHVAVADDGDNCVCDPAGIPPGGSAVNLIDPNDPAQVAAYLDVIDNCNEDVHACSGPSISIGEIHATASKIAPAYPLVIGQDDNKRGVDITWSVTVDPSTRTTYSLNKDGDCVAHTEVYTETATSQAVASLSAESRDWILNGDLQTHYPGAYLHAPDLDLGDGGSALNVPVADPGKFEVNVSGTTSGTPLQGPRSFSIDAGDFLAYLREIVITR